MTHQTRMMRLLKNCLAVAAVLVLGCTGSARAQGLFYRGVGVGSDAAFTPATFFLNDGFDILQLGNHDRDIWSRNYRRDWRNVWDNLSHPFENIRRFGTRDFISQELFPLNFSMEQAQWAPNYQLHLIGGGIAYRTLLEWYRAHGVPLPTATTLVTVFGTRMLNELNENNGRKGVNIDPVADLYLFDTAAIVLFSVRPVQRFFAHTLNAAVWGKQPAFVLPSGELHNTGQYFAFKLRLPGGDRTYLFSHFGLGLMGGVSRRIGEHDFVSVSVGAKTSKSRAVDKRTGLYTVVPAPSAAIFWDRNHSLLASLQVSDVARTMIELNVYPGILPVPGTGFWVSVAKNGGVHFGLSTRVGIGAGF